MNLDLDFIDFPTGWAIQRAGLTHTDERCSAVQTDGAMLCDCNALPLEWARLKAAHDGSDGLALAAPYLSSLPPEPRCACGAMTLATTVSENHARGLHGADRCIGGWPLSLSSANPTQEDR